MKPHPFSHNFNVIRILKNFLSISWANSALSAINSCLGKGNYSQQACWSIQQNSMWFKFLITQFFFSLICMSFSVKRFIACLTLNLPRSYCQFSPLAPAHFLAKLFWGFGLQFWSITYTRYMLVWVFSLPNCWTVYGYYGEKLLVNHLWAEKG